MTNERWKVVLGECVEAMRAMPAESVDAVVCDPPYGLEFMGKAWDSFGKDTSHAYRETPRITDRGDDEGTCYRGAGGRGVNHFQAGRPFQSWCETWAREALRVLKPGGHLVAFGGSRTYHRLASGVEDAGFEIRDQLQWLYGSGFPKSLDVSKAIDKAAGATRKVVGPSLSNGLAMKPGSSTFVGEFADRPAAPDVTAPATLDAQRWDGWGTALKPAHEPIVLARKPLRGTVAGNVLAHGTGALNIAGARVGQPDGFGGGAKASGGFVSGYEGDGFVASTQGRWPANVVLDEGAAALLDEQAPMAGAAAPVQGTEASAAVEPGTITGARARVPGAFHGDRGGASRFFYVAKASRAEREAGLGNEFALGMPRDMGVGDNAVGEGRGSLSQPRRNVHPTVKPVDVMRWLVRLVCPEGGLVLDPFNGSGSTGIAAVLEGRRYVGLEREAEYVAIAEARIAWWAAAEVGMTTPVAMKSAAFHEKARAGGQFGFWDDDEDDA